MEGAGNVPCPEVCRQDKYQLKDGYLKPANNQLLALNATTKYSIVPATGERIVVTYILMKPRPSTLLRTSMFSSPRSPFWSQPSPTRKRLTKKGPDAYEEDTDMKELRLCADNIMDTRTTVPGRTSEVWEQHERDRHMPKFPDCPVRVQEHGSVVKHFSNTTNGLHTLHLDTGDWRDIQGDQGTESVNHDFEKHAGQHGIHLATSPAHEPQSNGIAETSGSRETMYTPFASSCKTSRFVLELRHAICCRNASS